MIKFAFDAVCFVISFLWVFRQEAVIVLLLLGVSYELYFHSQEYTWRLRYENTYVYGHLRTIPIYGRENAVESINVDQLVDSPFDARLRRLLHIQKKFQITNPVVIRGDVRNVRLVGRRMIKVEGNADNCTLVTSHGFVSVSGSVVNHSHIRSEDLIIKSYKSGDTSFAKA